MKPFPSTIVFFCLTLSLVADRLQIGTFNLPYRFEDNDITDTIRHVVTNDVQAYCYAVRSFTPPFQENDGKISINYEMTPAIVDRSPLFNDGLSFIIENGSTNCVIKQSITDAAKAVANELPAMTNLIEEANLFVNDVLSGSITNRTADEIRSAICYVRDGELRHPTVQEADDELMRTFVASMKGKWVPLPLCHLDISQVSTASSTNTFRYLPLRGYDAESSPAYRHILSTQLVFLNGHWSFCVDGTLVFRNKP